MTETKPKPPGTPPVEMRDNRPAGMFEPEGRREDYAQAMPERERVDYRREARERPPSSIPEELDARRNPLIDTILMPYEIVSDFAYTIRRTEGLGFMLGLGVAAAFGAIEWPVAVAVGMGTAVARGMQRRDNM